MPRTKRDAKSFTMMMDTATHERLEKYCEESGQTLTVAVERAINAYIDEYENEREFLKQHMKKTN